MATIVGTRHPHLTPPFRITEFPNEAPDLALYIYEVHGTVLDDVALIIWCWVILPERSFQKKPYKVLKTCLDI